MSRRAEPIGEATMLDSSKVTVDLSQSLSLGLVIGISTILR
jgi:hypothetical protein